MNQIDLELRQFSQGRVGEPLPIVVSARAADEPSTMFGARILLTWDPMVLKLERIVEGNMVNWAEARDVAWGTEDVQTLWARGVSGRICIVYDQQLPIDYRGTHLFTYQFVPKIVTPNAMLALPRELSREGDNDPWWCRAEVLSWDAAQINELRQVGSMGVEILPAKGAE